MTTLLASVLVAPLPALTQGKVTSPTPARKIQVSLTGIDANGLRGPADGKVAVAYEFCIPDTKKCRDEVRAIDATVHFAPGASGRIGAGKGQCLCIGSTHQKNYRLVLQRLAARPYIVRIIECYFE